MEADEGFVPLAHETREVFGLRLTQERDTGLLSAAVLGNGAPPFRDNVDHAHRHRVQYIADPGGSIRSHEVETACREHRITLVRTSLKLFHH